MNDYRVIFPVPAMRAPDFELAADDQSQSFTVPEHHGERCQADQGAGQVVGRTADASR